MASRILIAAILSITSASSLSRRQNPDPRKYPPLFLSDTFALVANVTDLSKDFTPPVHHLYFTGVHAGAGLDLITLASEGGYSMLFQNGTDVEIERRNGSILEATDGTFPLAVIMDDVFDQPRQSGLAMKIADGQPGIGITASQDPIARLYAAKEGTFLACDTGFFAPTHPQIVVRFSEATYENGVRQDNIPKNCTAINLLPQCTNYTLPTLRPDAKVTREFLHPVRCYKNVSEIEWFRWSMS
jgi:hypothetical protein